MRYVIQRILQVPLPVLLVLMIVFGLLLTTGDPARALLGDWASAEQVNALRHELGLDRPIYVQFGVFIRNVVTGNFGESLSYRRPALLVVLAHWPNTILLALVSMIAASAIGIPMGVLAAAGEGRAFDRVTAIAGVLGISIPAFWLGIVLMLIFAVDLHWLPSSGSGTWRHALLPAATLVAAILPQVVMLTRGAVLDVLREQYVVTAHAKGLSRSVVLYRHILRNGLNPVVTSLGLNLGTLLGGAVIVETIFAWPGVGMLSIKSVLSRDLPLVTASVFVLAVSIVVSNMLVDIINAYLDPRVREAAHR